MLLVAIGPVGFYAQIIGSHDQLPGWIYSCRACNANSNGSLHKKSFLAGIIVDSRPSYLSPAKRIDYASTTSSLHSSTVNEGILEV